jgi:hypothetical protein
MEELYRASIAASLFSQLFMFFLGMALFHLFYRVSRSWATILLASVVVSVAIAVASSITGYAVLAILSRPGDFAAFDEAQVAALGTLFFRLGNSGQALLEIFWTPFYVMFGLLVIRSRMMPVILGILLVLMGLGYFVNVFTKLLVPGFYPELMTQLAMLLGALGGIPTILWLLTKGATEYGTPHRGGEERGAG